MRSVRGMFLITLGVWGGVRLASAQTSSIAERVVRPRTYGTTNSSFVAVAASEFSPIDSTFTYTSDVNAGARWSTNTSRADTFSAPLRLPGGAKLIQVFLEYIDIDPANAVFASLVECDLWSQNCVLHPAAGAGDADCLTPGYICSGNAFAGGEGGLGADVEGEVIIDNSSHTYRLIAGNLSGNSNTKIGAMAVSYVLQVSPQPGAATFNDVPTTHPFFQYVEALAASGITGGCNASPPLYCPGAPVTRGQMAVFLAKALGLQFP